MKQISNIRYISMSFAKKGVYDYSTLHLNHLPR
jgi:hypothetical protein